MGLATVLGLSRLGFFIPYRYAAQVTPDHYPGLLPIFAAAEPQFNALLGEVNRYSSDLMAISSERGRVRFTQDWFPRLDAAAAYAMVRREQPARIVEVGSGHSTRFLARAVSDGALATRIDCIDPKPRASLGRIGVHHHPFVLAKADPAIIGTLKSGDILFIDSSHIAMPGTDVDRLFLDTLPQLPSGVIVHIHDVLLPDAYPAAWDWRGYNEQLLVGTLLQGLGYEMLFASHYVATRMAPAVEGTILGNLPLVKGALETSLWLRKR